MEQEPDHHREQPGPGEPRRPGARPSRCSGRWRRRRDEAERRGRRCPRTTRACRDSPHGRHRPPSPAARRSSRTSTVAPRPSARKASPHGRRAARPSARARACRRVRQPGPDASSASTAAARKSPCWNFTWNRQLPSSASDHGRSDSVSRARIHATVASSVKDSLRHLEHPVGPVLEEVPVAEQERAGHCGHGQRIGGRGASNPTQSTRARTEAPPRRSRPRAPPRAPGRPAAGGGGRGHQQPASATARGRPRPRALAPRLPRRSASAASTSTSARREAS
jgi:hypothetical protein